jgi:hypothetical protein
VRGIFTSVLAIMLVTCAANGQVNLSIANIRRQQQWSEK